MQGKLHAIRGGQDLYLNSKEGAWQHYPLQIPPAASPTRRRDKQCLLIRRHITLTPLPAYRQAGVKVGKIITFPKTDISDSLRQSIFPIPSRTSGRMRSINSDGVTILNE